MGAAVEKQFDKGAGNLRTRDRFLYSNDANILMGLLRKLNEGETVRWEEISLQTGFDVRARDRLRNRVITKLADEGVHIGTLVGHGLKRLTEPETLDFCQGKRQSAHRLVRRNADRLATVDDGRLEKPDKERLLREKIHHSALLCVHRAPDEKLLPKGGKEPASIGSILKKLGEKSQ